MSGRISDKYLAFYADGRRFGPAESRKMAVELRDARAEIARLTASYEARLADAYQSTGALIHAMGLSDNADCIRLQDVLAYGKTEDGVDLLPWPRDPGALEKASDIARLTAERDQARDDAEGYDESSQRYFEGMQKAERAFSDLQNRYDALLAERAGVSEAMVARIACGVGNEKIVRDLCWETARARYPHADKYGLDEIGTGLLGDVHGLVQQHVHAALATPIPTPVDREAIRAEAFEEAAKIADEAPQGAYRNFPWSTGKQCHQAIAEAIRSAAKTEASR